MIRVKICGIKRKEDALIAVQLGADAVGLLVGQEHNSDDFIDADTARDIVKALPPYCSSVMVTHLTDTEDIIDLASRIGVTTVQVHGESTPKDAVAVRDALPYIKIYKTLHVTDESSIESGKEFLPVVDAILLDTANHETGQVGGTGLTHDWSISRRIVDTYDKPVILAGGLNPDNVAHAIEVVAPYAVDVNSGTKADDGYKSPEKLRAFIQSAKNVSAD